MKFTAIKAGIVVAATVLSGCASIINDKSQQVNLITTNNKPVKGNIDGIPFSGPGIVSVLRAKNDKIITAETEGCAPQTILPKSVDPIFFGNIIFGGLFGSTTDYSTEEMWKYQDSVVITCN